MTKQLLHITALSTINNKRVDLYYVSIAQAAHFNPYLTDFRVVGVKGE